MGETLPECFIIGSCLKVIIISAFKIILVSAINLRYANIEQTGTYLQSKVEPDKWNKIYYINHFSIHKRI